MDKCKALHGGMNDVLYSLYRVTGDASSHLRLAKVFDKPCFTAPLALGDDPLSGRGVPFYPSPFSAYVEHTQEEYL